MLANRLDILNWTCRQPRTAATWASGVSHALAQRVIATGTTHVHRPSEVK